MNFKFAYYFVFFIVFANCNQHSIKKNYESHLGKRIEFPENLYYLNGNSTQLTTTFEKYKMVVMLNGNCFKCVETLNNKWYYFYTEYSGKIKFIFIMRTTDNQYFIDHILPDIYINPVYILDENDIFLVTNNISPDPLFHTFLLNNKNEICLIGDPTINSSMYELYKEKIQN